MRVFLALSVAGAIAATVVSITTVGATGPTAWQLLDDGDPPQGRFPMVYDTARGRPVLLTESGQFYGGLEAAARPPGTWELVGADWVRRFIPEPTPWYSNGCMAFDASRSVTVLFGGRGNDETWEYDGTTWVLRSLTVRPQSRWRCGMAYDASRGRIVMFGGEDEALQPFGDTWEYDGTQWVQRMFSTSPVARSEPGMTYDSDRGVILLFGGREPLGGMYGDIWEYDGTRWRDKTPSGPSVSPSARAGPSMAFDPVRKRTVVFGGYTPAVLSDTWEWNGMRWTQMAPLASPEARRRMALVWDPGRGKLLGFGGEPDNMQRNDTWTYDGTTWTRIAISGLPGVRAESGMTFDPLRDALVLYGGRNYNKDWQFPYYFDTWIYSNGSWQEDTGAGSPESAESNYLVFDEGRMAVQGFSGLLPSALPSLEVHRYEGSPASWTGTNFCCPRPDGRVDHAVIYAAALGGMAVYGGRACCFLNSYYVANDLWIFDGATWSRHDAPVTPAGRWSHGMAYDSARGRLIIHGGLPNNNEGTVIGDTWVYDGTSWQQLYETSPPGLRRGHSMIYDPARDRVVLLGNGPPLEGVTWEYDGNSWVAMPTPFMPDETRCWMQLAYDTKRQVVWLFGGQNCAGQGYFNDTWAYGPDPDGDGKVGGLDNCPDIANPEQSNTDGDARGDPCDCAPSDASAWSAPQGVSGLQLAGTGTTTLTWVDQAGAVGPGVRYDVAAGDLAELRAGTWSTTVCVAPQTAVASASDERVPAEGAGYWYLVRARNVCGIGGYGSVGLDAASPCP